MGEAVKWAPALRCAVAHGGGLWGYCSTWASNAERESQAASVSVATFPWRSWTGMVTPCRIPNSLASCKSNFCLLVSFVSNLSADHAKGSVVVIERAITGSILSYRFTNYFHTQH